MNSNWVDHIIIVIIVLSMIISVIRGFVKEALSLVVWILAFVIAARYSAALSQLFATHVQNQTLRLGISFGLLVIATLIIGGMVNFLLGEVIVKTGLGGTNRLIGCIFGLLRGVIVVAGLILLVQLSTIPKTRGWQDSYLVPRLQPVAQWLKAVVPNNMEHFFKFANTKVTPKLTQK